MNQIERILHIGLYEIVRNVYIHIGSCQPTVMHVDLDTHYYREDCLECFLQVPSELWVVHV